VADPRARQHRIVAETTCAKREQYAGTGQYFLIWLARIGLMRWFSRRQRLSNVMESNVTGPAEQITMLGAPVVDVIPVGVLAGNLTLAFLAFSYAGNLTVTVCADSDRHPDLSVLVDALRADWAALSAHAVR
jgi:hypothetical protein